jgi:Asp-tRNA(Asn)/Glu-tRNA(Gln) amidotransferase A subunit family amidase
MSGFKDYDEYDALGLAKLVREKQVSAAEVLDAAVERVERLNGTLNAVCTKLYDHARRAIADGLPDGPLAGVPFLLKDIGVLFTGAVTTNGSRFFADAVADHDSEITIRYRRAGLVILGKSNTPELGLSPTTEPQLFGPTKNPWSLAHSAGGSSGGAAAAVASGMLPLAHATDGGGSIRIPASCCGLFGMKPTRARNPAGPDVGEGWSGASIGHAVSRTVRDSAALLDASSGPDVGDPYWAPPPARPFLHEVGAAPGRLRIAVCTTPWNGWEVSDECRAAVADAAKLCASLGHEIEEARPEIEGAPLRQGQRVVVAANVRMTLDRRAAALGREVTAADVEPLTWRTAQYAREVSAADYAAGLLAIHRAGRAVGRFFTRYDVLLTPTMCRPPHLLGELDTTTDDVEAYNRVLFGTIAFTSLFNAAGNPAMSVPLSFTADGLPVGVQFVGGFGDEARLFRLAAQLEAARPWAQRRPPVR